MRIPRHKVFISYHHAKDQARKRTLIRLNRGNDIFIDVSVDTGNIDKHLSDQAIRQKIRDEYLRDSSVTIVLVGTETKKRKHVDWEIYSSMFDGKVNKRSGILVINLPSTGCTNFYATHGEKEENILYPSVSASDWTRITSRAECERLYPYMPSRIIDNLESGAKISVVNWDTITADTEKLKLLIDLTYKDKSSCNYNLSTPMRRANS